ncbi:hypothetical protein [Nitrosomonas marina]|uniref:Uncharacterized protein n=1 Tax=Nitrosomonas marina TaxID=917 RepID=A0A1H8G530_9PROT|nr:hypothetical protein [Nitrosomonas marina]SEN38597.1 hypothetical protein SAMN05216325_11619 [Nitrosomonas marina]
MAEFDPHNAGNLTAQFDASRRISSAELVEEIRHNYYTAAQMQNIGDPTIGGLTVNTSGRTDMDYPGSDNQKKRERDERMLALMIHNMTLQQIEDQLAARYGENFAENLAAEYLDEESYKRLMSIEDKTERRRQIAVELNQGIRDGSIDADKILGNSDFEGWLHAHDMEDHQRAAKAGMNNGSIDLQKTENSYQITNTANESAVFDTLIPKK